MTALQEHLGSRLAAARELRGLTQQDAAHDAFLDPERLALIESGSGGAFFDEVRLLCLLYRVSMEDLIGGYEPTRQPRPKLDRTEGTAGGTDDDAHGTSGTVQAMRTNGRDRLATNGNTRITLPPRTLDPRPPRSFLRIAAIVLGCVVLIGAVGVGTAVLWPSPPRDVMNTLSYRDAVLILVDGKETDKRRELSAARVFGATLAGARALLAVSQENGRLADQAKRGLTRLRDVLQGDGVFTLADSARTDRIREPLLGLRKALEDKTRSQTERGASATSLIEQVGLGILALKKSVAEDSPSPAVKANVGGYLATLRRALGK